MEAPSENLQLSNQEESNTLQAQAIVKITKISVRLMMVHFLNKFLGLKQSVGNAILKRQLVEE